MTSALVVASLLFTFFLCSIQADLIDETCSMASNRPLCLQVFRSDPRSKGADIRGLAQIVLEKAQAAAQGSLKAAQSITKAPGCIAWISDAIVKLKDCSPLIKIKGFPSINALQSKASSASEYLSDCDQIFNGYEPANLKRANQLAEDLIDILLTISNGLV